jgi:hypothetical protein
MVSSRQRAPHSGYGIFGLRFGARFCLDTPPKLLIHWYSQARPRSRRCRALQLLQNSCAEICFSAGLPDMRYFLNTFRVAEDLKTNSQCRSSVS